MADPNASTSISALSAEPRKASPRRRASRAIGAGAPRVCHQDDLSRGERLTAMARELAIQSRREQGLPDHIADPRALAEGAQLVLAARRRRNAPQAARPP